MVIEQIDNCGRKEEIARRVLEALPDWFGLKESREAYIQESKTQYFFAAMDQNEIVGFLCLKETGKATLEISVMGVFKEYHRRGIGTALFMRAQTFAKEKEYRFLQVKTVQMGRYREYDATNRFYLSLGFQEFEIFPTLWDEWNPCQVYVMAL